MVETPAPPRLHSLKMRPGAGSGETRRPRRLYGERDAAVPASLLKDCLHFAFFTYLRALNSRNALFLSLHLGECPVSKPGTTFVNTKKHFTSWPNKSLAT
jgi:hypothetical protein